MNGNKAMAWDFPNAIALSYWRYYLFLLLLYGDNTIILALKWYPEYKKAL